jgi:hypothetical protein
MTSKQVEGHVSTHDIEYTAKRKISWKNDLALRQRG